MRIAQTPRSVAPTSTLPMSDTAVAKWMVIPFPPFTNVAGAIPSPRDMSA